MESRIERIDPDTGQVYVRSYGIKNNVIAVNKRFNWMTHGSDQDADTGIGQPVIVTPTWDHYYHLDPDIWNENQKPLGIATIIQRVKNKETGANDYIWRTDLTEKGKRAALAIKEGKIPRFVSPGIYSKDFYTDSDGVVHYKRFRVMHLAIVKKPAFGEQLARINETICVGGSRCAQELAAIASFSNLVNDNIKNDSITDFDPYDILTKLYSESEPNESDKSTIKNNSNHIQEGFSNASKMSGNEGSGGTKTVPFEVFEKLQKELESKDLTLRETLDLNAKLNEEKKSIAGERDTYKGNWDKKEREEKQKALSEKFGKIFKDEKVVNEKVELFLNGNMDFDKIYGEVYNEALEKEKQEEENNSKPDSTQPEKAAGIASGSGVKIGLNANNSGNKLDIAARELAHKDISTAFGLFTQRRMTR
jgi:hypothetical protein